MRAVIQCAGSKFSRAGMLTNGAGTRVRFVADTKLCTPESNTIHARPDDHAQGGETWREVLDHYNESHRLNGINPDDLLSAGNLYVPPIYRTLMRSNKVKGLYILSAGWGLVKASFLLPDYDITFSTSTNVARRCRRGSKDESWQDYNHLEGGSPVHFFGGLDYLPLFYKLTAGLVADTEIVIHHKAEPPRKKGYRYEQFKGTVNTNWHYQAAKQWIGDKQPQARRSIT